MALNFDKYSISAIDTATGFDLATGECLFIFDEIKNGSIEGAAEVRWSTGRKGRRLFAVKNNKTCTVTLNNGFIVGGALALSIGDFSPTADFNAASILIPAFERIEVGESETIKISHKAVGVCGNEIGFIYKANKDGSQGEPYTQNSAASSSSFAYDGETEITLPTDEFNRGDIVIVFYEYLTKGVKYSNKSNSYSGSCKLILDVLAEDVCTGAVRHSKLVMPKVLVNDKFNFSFGDDMSVQSFSAEARASVCEGRDSEYFYWIFPDGN
ncbi:MAG: hypothetical protein FWG70_11905 [Oscillospiraceae bacterium]|nr:hypothetical protein [Oscillospiraceae bacterium]